MNSKNRLWQQGDSCVTYDVSLLSRLVQRVFLWMTMGLAISAMTSQVVLQSASFMYTLLSSPFLLWGLIIAEFGLVFILSSRVMKMSFAMGTALFAGYSVLSGVTIAPILAIYTSESVVQTFLVTAGTFGVMALFGYVTKRDLSQLGSILMMALVGLVIASLVNLFLGSGILSLIISAVGVLIFVGLTAYDVQKMKVALAQVREDSEEVKKLSVLFALVLYLDFINLFLYLLRFLGRRD